MTSLGSCGEGDYGAISAAVEKTSCDVAFLIIGLRPGGQPDPRLVGGDAGSCQVMPLDDFICLGTSSGTAEWGQIRSIPLRPDGVPIVHFLGFFGRDVKNEIDSTIESAKFT